MISWPGLVAQLTVIVLAVLLAPILQGWINQCRAWMQNKSGPGILQPYRTLRKLFAKEVVLAHNASPLFRATPYVLFACMCLAAGIVPTLGTDLPFSPAADAIALVGIFALARVFISLAAMDIGTAFGTLGARREMMVGFLAEPALLMVLFTASLISHSTSLATIVEHLAHMEFVIYPSLAFAGVAFTMVSLAENARIPVDNPSTHLELTMVHEAMVLEYSGRDLALIDATAALKLLLWLTLISAVFFPFGLASAASPQLWPVGLLAWAGKVCALTLVLAAFETAIAKMRVFRVPEFLGVAILLGLLAAVFLFVSTGFAGYAGSGN